MTLLPKNPRQALLFYAALLFVVFLSLLFAHKSSGQDTWLRVEQGSGIPANNPTNPAPKTGYVKKDSLTGQWYQWTSGVTWKPTNIFNGLNGKDGSTPVFVTGGVTTLTPNTPATGAVRSLGNNTYAIDLGVPAGIQGVPGQNGTGGGVPGLLSPDDFKAKHTAQLISQSDLAFFASVGATTSDMYDWAAWQMCMNQCDMKTIVIYGTYYWNRSVIKPDLARCKITGNAKVVTTNNNSFAMLTTSLPSDFSAAEARCGAGANFVIDNLRLEGTLNQIGFRPYATSNNILTNVSTAGLGTGIWLQFCLAGIYDNITCLNGTNGFINGWGGYTGDTPISSRFPTSNGSKIRNFHAVSITNIGIANYGGYDVEINIDAIEGNGTIARPIELNDMGNTALKNFVITDGGDFEGVSIANGTGNAYIHIETVVGNVKVKIFGTNMQTAGKFIWAKGANSPCIILENVNNIFSATGGSTSLYSDGYTWQFNYCAAYPFPAAITPQFSTAEGGKAVTPCKPDVNGQPPYNAQGCGSDHYNYLTQGK